jgi:transcriptional regulator with PAS, ATPase and Fis domain
MKSRNYHISLYFIVPLIFSSLSILSLVVTYHLVLYAWRTNTDIYLLLSFWGVLNVGATFAIAFGVFWIIFKPMDRFIKEAERIPAVQQQIGARSLVRGDQLAYFSNVVHHVTDILSKVDATELFPNIIGQSKALRSVLGQLLKVSPSEATVLITGESGTGKEVIAEALHNHSRRKTGPLVAVNCAAIPEGLLESELFGHEKGAFTGATVSKKGKFEIANKGTIFLDEIGDMPLETQAKMLRVLESGVLERVGGGKPIACDVRVVAATNKNIEAMIKAGEFREDLYHRLNVFRLHLPPLRERREDIPLLSSFFLEKFDKTLALCPETLQLLVVYPWPGNVRELRNAMERAAVLAADTGKVAPQHLPAHIGGNMVLPVKPEETPSELNLDERLEELEKTLILNALAQAGGVQVRAAEHLGIKERSLWHRIKKYGIDVGALKD